MVPLMVIYHWIESVQKSPTKQIQTNEDVFRITQTFSMLEGLVHPIILNRHVQLKNFLSGALKDTEP